MKAIQVSQVGGPEMLTLAEVPVPQPKPNEALVQIKADVIERPHDDLLTRSAHQVTPRRGTHERVLEGTATRSIDGKIDHEVFRPHQRHRHTQ